ncbi:hypothetical protein [Fredinandcohnia quinoae]|uniref:Tissue inhibitor of metalloproteinase n=1 Tax=Fredinandcohnia quinoae TaxID=2918902 RepID=A0AAW5E5V1_9BACI|nr:hypothetical protein [Fredinandcohnia sp. SECRCQ15]MCH1625267.1 hypothetical protein [Fredinandcohnia sp. SECRCQ15]
MKKVISSIVIVIVFLQIISSFPTTTSACSCAGLSSVEEEFKRSEAVFSGKVISVKDKRSSDGYTVKSVLFEVMNTWKGVKQSQIIITTGQGGGDCGIEFIEGTEYLVYATESDMYGEKSLITIMCDRTSTLSSSAADLTILGEGQPPTEVVDLTKKQNGIQKQTGLIVGGAIVVFVVVYLLLRNKAKKMK